MKRLGMLVFAIVFVMLAGTSVYALEAFEINSYDVTMNVRDDNTYEVTETIAVKYTEPRHGIIRNIPLTTYDGSRAFIKNIKIPGYDYSTSRYGEWLDIKIGDADEYANTFETYVIKYLFIIGKDKVDDMDGLYFNIIGTQWDTYIENVTFNITMPFAFDESKLDFYSGYQGYTDNKQIEYRVDGNVISGKLGTRLAPYQGLTIDLELPEGYYTNAVEHLTLGMIISRYYMLFLGFFAILAFVLWYFYGRNKRIFPTVEFYAPEDLTPAEIGYIFDGSVDPKDVTSLILYWADRNLLTITENKKEGIFGSKTSFTLTKAREMYPGAKNYEKEMFDKLFIHYGDGRSVNTEDLKNIFYVTINSVKKMIENAYNLNKSKNVYKFSGKVMNVVLKFIAYITTFITLFSLFVLIAGTEYEGISMIGFAAVAILPVWYIVNLIVRWDTFIPRKRFGMVFAGIMMNAFILGPVIYYSFSSGQGLLFIFGFAVSVAILALSCMSNKRTELGDRYMERILGLRNFIENAEKDRINALVEENPKYFYDVLPYALVLNVTDKWARKFEHITMDQPEWYSSQSGFRTFSTVIFANAISSSMSNISSSMTSMPSSSGGGSFGGGFSGGGSGGGGGSSW
ncbi:MAG: DUF2207 domain-containing protein [Eubacteriales bacterium]|nr:DUF2207 domain-containing protein [Eubacteriales bacterium]